MESPLGVSAVVSRSYPFLTKLAEIVGTSCYLCHGRERGWKTILKLPILLFHNNKVGHRINKVGHRINKC